MEKNPIKIVTLLKIMMIPAPLKNYGVGILRVTFCEFFIPTVITSPILASVWIYVGTEMGDIYDAVNEGEGLKEVTYFKFAIIILTICIFFYLTFLTKSFYDDVVKEIEEEKKKEEE